MRLIVLFILIVISNTTMAQSKMDSTHYFTFKKTILPASMIAYGALAISFPKVKAFDLDLKNVVRGNQKITIDNYIPLVPPLSVYALNLAGVKGKHNLKQYTAIAAISIFTNTVVVNAIKYSSKIQRPDSSSFNSFPSGHTSSAFVGAELFHQEYGHLSPWYSIAGYTIATATGYLRMHNNRHWFSDVVTGAGIGILGTRFSYWMYPKVRKWFGKSNEGNTMLISPTQNGFGLVYTFK